MEENPLNNKIKKQLEFIKEQISRFKRGFQGKQIKSQNFIPYLEALSKVFDLNNSYAQDYYELIERKSLNFILKNNRDLMKDVCFKLKALSSNLQQSKTQSKQNEKSNDGICKMCNHLIQSKNVQNLRNQLEDVGINKLKKMLQMIQQQTNVPVFTESEDIRFFQQLQKVLNKKQSILSITENNLEKYLEEIMRAMEEVKHLEGLKDTSFTLPQQIDWETKIKNQINNVLLGSFKGKVPVWIQKMFDYFIKLQSKYIRQQKQSKSSQTQQQSKNQISQLKSQIQHYRKLQQMNRSINQDYLNLLQEKKDRIQSLQLQINALKGHSNQKDVKIGRKVSRNVSGHAKDQVKVYKNEKSKVIDQEQSEAMMEVVSPQHKFRKMAKNSSLISDSARKSHLIQKMPTQESQFLTQNSKITFRKQFRKESIETEHLPLLPTTVLQEMPKRSKSKKLTDIESFKKSRSNSQSQKFLPSLQKLQSPKEKLKSKESNKVIKKQSSIFTSHRQNINNNSQKIENEQNSSQYAIQSQLNLTENESEPEPDREARLQKYKQRVLDVQAQLQSKTHKIGALKRTFEIKKIKSSASFTADISPLGIMGGQRFASSILPGINFKTQMKSVMTQTQNLEPLSLIMGQTKDMKGQKTKQKTVRIAQYSEGLKHRGPYKTQPNESIHTELSMKSDLLKNLQNNQQFLNVGQTHLQNIFNKLFNYDLKTEANTLQTKSPHKAQLGKSSEMIKGEKSLNKSRMQKIRSEHSQMKNENLLIRQGSLPNLFETKQALLKSKLKENLSTRDVSSTIKSKTNESKESAQCLPSTSIHTINKKNEVCLFTKKDFILFIGEENSFRYESGMTKKYHKPPSILLTKAQAQNLASVYGLTQIIKSHSLEDYGKIISFIKYPYQSVVNNFSILNIVKDMGLESWLRHFSMIKYYHNKCITSSDSNPCICDHVESFATKIQDMVVAVVKPKLTDLNQQ